MSTHEKLVRLIQEVVEGCDECRAALIADHLMENGVTVKEPQKPMAFSELAGYLGRVLWLEVNFEKAVCPMRLDSWEQWGVWFDSFENVEGVAMRASAYGSKWRCWAEEPTDEERMAAKWEE